MKADYDIFDFRHYSAKIDIEKRQRACQAFWRNVTKYGNTSNDMYYIGMMVCLVKQMTPMVELYFF